MTGPSPGRWHRLLRSAPEATFFHTRQWAEAACRAFGWEYRPLVGTVAGRTVLCAAFDTDQGWQSAPIGYGGVLIPDDVGSNAPTRLPVRLAEVENLLGGRLTRLVQPPGTASVTVPPDRVVTTRQTSRVRLHPEWERTWGEVITGNARTAVRAAWKRGTTVALVVDPDHVAALYPVYEESMARVGADYRTPLGLLSDLVALGDRHTWLLAARQGRETVGWGLFLRFEKHLFHWISVYRAAAGSVLPVHAILHAALRRACESGVTLVDLGASHTAAQRFAKSRWGASLDGYVALS